MFTSTRVFLKTLDLFSYRACDSGLSPNILTFSRNVNQEAKVIKNTLKIRDLFVSKLIDMSQIFPKIKSLLPLVRPMLRSRASTVAITGCL